MSNISIAGNVGADPVLRYAKTGNAFLTVPVAVTTGRDDTKETHWFDVKCFGDLAERMAEVPKGSRVMFIGRMKHPKGGASDRVAKEAVQTVQAAFANDEEPF